MTPVSAKARDLRAQAVASVTQDMGSARIKILGDLMESRKRAEQHEQEFLRTIHSENASFSQIVSLFESSLDELRTESLSINESVQDSIRMFHQEMNASRSELKNVVESEIISFKQSHEKVVSSHSASLASLSSQVDSVHGKTLAIQSSLEYRLNESDAKHMELLTSLDTMNVKQSEMSNKLMDLSARFDALEKDIQSRCEDQLRSLSADLAALKTELDTKVDQQVQDAERRVRDTFEARLAGLEEILEGNFRDRIDTASVEQESKWRDDLSQTHDKLIDGFMKSEEALKARLDSLESCSQNQPDTQVIQSLIVARVEQLVEQFGLTGLTKSTRDSIRNLEERMSNLRSDFNTQLAQLSSILNAVAHSGFHYEWRITDAIARFKSLGLLGSPGKFVNSETFNLGPYNNMSLRFFPVSTVTGESPTIWLIQRPESPEASVPLYVDIAIGSLKRGPLKRKHVQELFGHWVWEGSFQSDIVSSEKSGDDLSISVEISMRQWMDLEEIAFRQQQKVAEEEIPDSPSAMSTFTFVPQLPQTNPFNEGSVTPRRSSWAQFANSPDENKPIATSRAASNPFK